MTVVEQSPFQRFSRPVAWTLVSLLLVLVCDAGGLDLALARLAGNSHGFPLKENWFVSVVLHQWARQLAWGIGFWMLAGLWWPTGILRQLSPAARLQWLGSALLALLLINLLKHSSQTSCPWDLAEFGGVANHLSHWAWGQPDGGPGHCFPAGHASAAFAFIGGYFVFRPISAGRARQLLAAVLALGLLIGLAQQLRGAHFTSHTLWTAWLCWTVSWAVSCTIKLFSPAADPLPSPP